MNAMIDFISSLEGIKKIKWNNKTIVTDIASSEQLDKLKEEVLKSMPTENGSTVENGLEMSAGSASVTYKFRIKYYNEAECPVKIGDVFYTTINEACAVGGVIDVVNDSNEAIVVPAGKEVTLNLNGHTLANDTVRTMRLVS